MVLPPPCLRLTGVGGRPPYAPYSRYCCPSLCPAGGRGGGGGCFFVAFFNALRAATRDGGGGRGGFFCCTYRRNVNYRLSCCICPSPPANPLFSSLFGRFAGLAVSIDHMLSPKWGRLITCLLFQVEQTGVSIGPNSNRLSGGRLFSCGSSFAGCARGLFSELRTCCCFKVYQSMLMQLVGFNYLQVFLCPTGICLEGLSRRQELRHFANENRGG